MKTSGECPHELRSGPDNLCAATRILIRLLLMVVRAGQWERISPRPYPG